MLPQYLFACGIKAQSYQPHTWIDSQSLLFYADYHKKRIFTLLINRTHTHPHMLCGCVCEGESKRDTKFLCEALNCFHMSRAHTASADSLIKLSRDEGERKKEAAVVLMFNSINRTKKEQTEGMLYCLHLSALYLV